MKGTLGFQDVRPSTSRSPSYRFLHEQRHRLGTGDWHLLHTREHITFFPGSNTKEGKASDIVSNSRMARIIWVLWQAQQ